jgi:hypothetical protein
MPYRRPAASALVLLLAALLFVPTADAQYFGQNRVQYEVFDFKTLETEHFVFHFYPAEEDAVRDAARMAERWYDRHTQVFLHRFDEKKPIIFYANDADFQQTNVAQRQPSQGTGGLTEPLRERVVMPLASSYGETDHVLGHELVHSFQFDLGLNADSLNIQLGNLPLWLIEGMAEYLSVGRRSTHTAMWMRDAVRRDTMPTFEELANPRAYFPYRYGQAYLAYIAGKYGDQAVTDLFKAGGSQGLKRAYPRLFGISADSLTREWAEATREAYRPLMADRTSPDSLGTDVLSPDIDGGRINIAPTLSPDGRYVAFISERDLFQFNLFVADAETGEVIAELDRAGTTGHFNALRFISSAGTWSPDGRRLAFVTSAEGDNQITIWNVQTEEIERSFKVKGVNALTNPAWAPGGNRLAFSGTDGGVSDLYVLNLETNAVRQLTNDRYADLQPTWAPDGETIAFTTDRAETNLDRLAPSKNMDLGLIDVESREITVREPFGNALHHNPQFSPDGRSLYFISDQDGFKDVYRMGRASGERRRVTHLKTGVSGITALSPAMSVAQQSGEMMLSVYGGGRYTGVRLPADSIGGTRLAAAPAAKAAPAVPPAPERTTADTSNANTTEVDTSKAVTTASDTAGAEPHAGILPPVSARNQGLVASNLADPTSGLPPAPADTAVADLDPSLSLEGVVSPGAGVSVGGRFGSQVGGGIAFRFGDMLGHRTLTVGVQARGTIRDIGGSVSYVNRRGQLNWGGALSHRPVIFRANSVRLGPTSAVSIVRRAFITSTNGLLSYPLDPTRRFEFTAGATRYGFGVNVESIGLREDPTLDELGLREARDPEYLATAGAAYVRDFSVSALTGPIQGGRWRLGVTPTTGVQNFVTARADVRRYFYKKPFTLAVQGLHVGNYGATFDTEFGVGNEYIGEPYRQGFVRGYNVRDISDGIRETGRCTVVQGDATRSQCAEIDRLFGTRSLVGRIELRVPLLGPERLSLIPLPYVPTTLGAFADAGVTWTAEQGPDFVFETESAATNIPVVSTGVTARFNVLGRFLVETYLARPFQRTDKTWSWGVRLSPGF